MIQNTGRIQQERAQPIFSDILVCDRIYSPELSVSYLTATEFVEISIVVEGDGFHQILNETVECHVGDMYILNRDTAHAYFAKNAEEKPTIRRIFFAPELLFDEIGSDFDNDSFCYGVFRDKLPVSYALLNSKTMNEVEFFCDRIAAETESKEYSWQDAVKSYLTMLLITVGRYINMADTLQPTRHKEWVTVSNAMRCIINRYSDPNMTLESIASSLYVSPSHLSRLFQKVIGESFLDYVRNVRITMACNLLVNTNLKNEEIVTRCGMKDVPSFYRLFKANMGITPYQYRMHQHTNYQNYKGETAMSIIEISENLQRGKGKLVKELVQKAIDEGIPATHILNDGLINGMNVIGEKFKNNEVYVPEVLVAARAMNMGMQVLKPLLLEDGVEATGKVCIGTVQGDLHDIGKNLVKMMMEGKGLEVVDLGTDVSPETFVKTAIEQDCKVICCSALLTTTMTVMEDVVKEAEKAGIRDRVKIMVGGAPITQEFCDKIGADCYTSDAASAADAAVELCK